jgi:hypothetical protein
VGSAEAHGQDDVQGWPCEFPGCNKVFVRKVGKIQLASVTSSTKIVITDDYFRTIAADML